MFIQSFLAKVHFGVNLDLEFKTLIKLKAEIAAWVFLSGVDTATAADNL